MESDKNGSGKPATLQLRKVEERERNLWAADAPRKFVVLDLKQIARLGRLVSEIDQMLYGGGGLMVEAGADVARRALADDGEERDDEDVAVVWEWVKLTAREVGILLMLSDDDFEREVREGRLPAPVTGKVGDESARWSRAQFGELRSEGGS